MSICRGVHEALSHNVKPNFKSAPVVWTNIPFVRLYYRSVTRVISQCIRHNNNVIPSSQLFKTGYKHSDTHNNDSDSVRLRGAWYCDRPRGRFDWRLEACHP